MSRSETDARSAEPDNDTESLVVWHDPPPTGKYGTRLEAFVRQLKERPGEWGELVPMPGGEQYPLSVGTNLRKTYPDIEYTSRTTETPNRHRIWARWIEPELDPTTERNLRSIAGTRRQTQKVRTQ